MINKAKRITLYKQEDFAHMRKAGTLAAEVLDYIADYIQPGITTGELDALCHAMILKHGAIPAPLNYKGFPKSVCISINHVICHGIPGDRKLENGDILNVDVTVILDGWYGDSSRMYFAGDKVPIMAKRLTQVTYEAMMLGIEQVRPGVKINEIGRAIQTYAEKHGYSVVRDFCGHGIGRVFHTQPNVLHYYDKNDDLELEEGMFFTVEPMINVGGHEVRILKDGWTAVTKDRSLSAQFEHTIGVTSDGYEIFTLSPKGYTQPPYK